MGASIAMKELRIDEIRQILESGDFDQFNAAIETEVFECKSIPYFLDQIHQKQELAKDVSGLANSGGGAIVVGLSTEAILSLAEEEVTEIRPFGQSLFDPQQYFDVLKSWIHPTVEGVQIQWFPQVHDTAKGLGLI